jgi:acyl-CoA thioesterase-1
MYLSVAACASDAPATAGSSAPKPSQGSGTGGPLVIFLGDSLTAGYGLPGELAFPSLVADELERRGQPIRVVNAGVSGDTTTGALERLDWLLKQHPDVLVVGLGANDAFRGQPVERIEATKSSVRQNRPACGCWSSACAFRPTTAPSTPTPSRRCMPGSPRRRRST